MDAWVNEMESYRNGCLIKHYMQFDVEQQEVKLLLNTTETNIAYNANLQKQNEF